MHTVTSLQSWPRVSRKNVRAQKRIDQAATLAVARAIVYRVEPLEARRLLSTTYYVAVNGSDGNAGTDPAHPFATIQAGLNKALTPGDVVQVAGGTYRGQYNTHFMASGNSSAPITLQAAPGQTVVVDGAVLVTGWTQVGGSPVYTYANWNHYFPAQQSGTIDARSEPRDQLFVDGQYLPEANSVATLTPGSFYVDPNGTHTISVWLADGSNPNNHAMEGTATDQTLLRNYNGSTYYNYITINGLQFQHCANIAGTGASEVQVFGGSNETVENITVQYAAGAGLGLSCNNSIVRNCHINHNGQEGIACIGSTNLSVIQCETAYNNTLGGKQFDVIFEAGATKFINTTGVVIDGLVSHDNWGDGLWFDINDVNATIRNCVISTNYGYGIHYEISQSATIYNNLIFNNHFHFNYQNGVDGYGIFISSSIGCTVYNNTIVSNDSIGFASSGLLRGNYFSYDNQFFNNIVVSNGPGILMTDVNAATATVVPAGTNLAVPYSYSKSDNNVLYNASGDPNTAIAGFYSTFAAWQAAGLDTHSQFASPQFVDQANSLFQLGGASPALSGGATSWPGVSIQEANPQIRGAHFDTLPVAVLLETPNLNGKGSLTFHVTFSEPVINVTTAAFGLTSTGNAGGTIAAVSASSGTSFQVTVNAISGQGTFRLDVLPNAIQDAAGLGKTVSPYNGGPATFLETNLTPQVTSIAPYITIPTARNFLEYAVVFNQAVTGVTASNFQVTTTGTVIGGLVTTGGLFTNPVAAGNGTTYFVTVGPTNIPEIVGTHTDVNTYPNPILGRGTLRLDFVNGGGNVTDASGAAVAGYNSGAVANIIDPAVTLTSPSDGSFTTNSQPTITGAAGTASGDSSTIELNIYPNTAASGDPIQTFTTTANNGAYSANTPTALAPGVYTVQARQANSAGTTGYSVANVFTVTSSVPVVVGQIDAGGPASGSYAADTDFSGGTAYGVSSSTAIDTSGVTNPAPQNVYQTERYGNFSYVLPGLTAGKQYTVRLDFAELYWNAAGQRVFNVSINGTTALKNFDIYAAVGAKNKAITESFTATADSNGRVTIVFTSLQDNAKVSAISITPVAPAGPPPTLTTPLYNSFNLTDSEADLAVAATGSGTLTYQWSSSPSVTFARGSSTADGSNIGELQGAGTYQFTVKITDSNGGGSLSQTISVVVPQIEESISLAPLKPTVADKGNQQFTATALDQFGSPMATQPGFIWTVSSGGAGGSISSAGLYAAPAAGTGTDTVNVSDANISGVNTTVTVAAQIAACGRALIDAGGPASGGFAADADFSGGTAYSAGNVPVDTSAITNPAPQNVYQTERYGNFTYTIPNLTAGAQYAGTLYFDELYWNAVGQRVFNVSINGSQLLTNFDIYAAVGGKNKAIAELFNATADAGGKVTIIFSSVKDNAKVSAIQITPAAGGTPSADLSITNTDSKTSVAAGTADTYTVVVSNAGPANVTGASVVDPFPAALTNLTYTAIGGGGATGFTANGNGNINDTAVNLPSGSSVTYTITGTVSPGATGTLADTASVTAPGNVIDPSPANNTATDSDTIANSGGNPPAAVAIDAGGPASGSFLADTDFSGGTAYSSGAAIDTSQVTNAAPQNVYQTERYGNFTYTVAGLSPGANYDVQLDFDELYWNAAGQRSFNVSINGTQVLKNFDIYAIANGKNKAIARLFAATADSGGKVTIAFSSATENAKVDGIEVTPI